MTKLPTAGKSNVSAASSANKSRAAFKKGGAVKGKGATVNIVIGGAHNPTAPKPAMTALPGGPPPGIPMPPPGPPMPAGLAGAGPVPGPVGAPPMKRGGSVMAGAGTGLGRMQKAAAAARGGKCK